ncbi:VCBS repeat-containing protein [Pseudoalteromonas sp. YIC-656]|uniref:FG-GAP repeat domain-containing protein n=1 Tax=Pseudoalteromonas pernae TaxID=3118054 RepID=UPI0032423DE5
MKGLLNVALFSTLVSATSAIAQPFSVKSLDFDFTISRPPLSANLTSHPGDEIVVFGRNQTQAQQIAVVALVDGELKQIDRFAIGEQYFGYDISDYEAEQDTLYFLAKDHIAQYQYPQKDGEARLLAFSDVQSIYRIAQSNYMKQIDFIYDINNDGLSDVVLPDFSQLNVWLSHPEREFKKVSLPVASHTLLERNEFSASPAQVFTLDVNNDGLLDIVYLEKGALKLHIAHKRHFEEQSVAIREGVYAVDWWDQLGEDGQPLDQSDLKYRKLERVEDVNGDKIPDLVVRYTQSSGVFDRTNDYEMYYGQLNAKGALSYNNVPNTTISSEGTLTDLQLQDIDGDGAKEVMVASFELGVGQVVSALLASSIDQDIFVYWQNQLGEYPKNPTLDYETEIGFSISKGRASEPLVMLSDIDGDGRKDLLFSQDDALLYRLNDGQRSFARSKKQTAPLPKSGNQISSADINSDGKNDLIMYYGKLDSAEKQKRLSVLIAQ